MSWRIQLDQEEEISVTNEELINHLSRLTDLGKDEIQQRLRHLSEERVPEIPLDEVIDQINSLGHHQVDQLYQYFTNPQYDGFKWYYFVTTTINRYLMDILQALTPEDLTFQRPYERREMALLWMGYNIISEIIEWLASQFRNRYRDGSEIIEQSGIIEPFVAILLDLASILVAMKMRRLVEVEFYEDEVDNDTRSWGFLLEDVDNHVLSQYMAVLMNTGIFIGGILGKNDNLISSLLYLTGYSGATAYNTKFIIKAMEGLIDYSQTDQSLGWIANLAQELGFMMNNDILNIGALPVPYDLLFNISTVFLMGKTLFDL